MNQSNTIPMNEGPMKTFISVLAGIGWAWPSTLEIVANPWTAFFVALIKAFVIGGFAWLGQTAAKEVIVSAKKRINNYKTKK